MANQPAKNDGRGRPSSSLMLKLDELTALLDHQLDDPSAVLDILINALSKGQDPGELWEKLHDAASRFEKMRELAFAYESVSADKRIKLLSPTQQAYTYLKAVDFFGQHFQDENGAIGYAERVLSAVPGHPEALKALTQLLSDRGQFEVLAKHYLEASHHVSDPERRDELLARAAELVANNPPDDELAITILSRIIAVDPTRDSARVALVDRLLAAGRAPEAAKLLEQQLLREPAPPDDVAIQARESLLSLYNGELGQPERALPHIEALLALHPQHEEALRSAEALLEHRTASLRAAAALSDAYEASGNIEGAITMLTVELKRVRGPRRVEVARRLGIFRQDVLDDPAGALELLGPVVAGDPGDDDVRNRFVKLSLSLDQPQQAARLLSRAMQSSRDPGVRARVGVDVGAVYLKSGDFKRAQATFQRVVEGGHDEASVLQAARQLGELYAESGDLRQLAAVLAVVVRHESEKEARQAAARRLARLCEGEVPDDSRAVIAYRALIGSPWTDEALNKLEELYKKLGSHEGMAEVLAHRAERTKDPEQARELAFRSAELRTTQTQDRAAALDAWRSLVQRFGPSREVFAQMVPLLEQQKDWVELGRVLEADIALASREEQASLLSKLGQLRLTRLEDVHGALKAFRDALGADPSDRASRAALEKLLVQGEHRLLAANILEPVLRREEPGVLWVRVLETRGELEAEPSARLSAFSEAVQLAEQRLHDPERALSLSGRALALAVEAMPEALSPWLEAVLRLSAAAGDPARRAELLLTALGEREVTSPRLLLLARATGDALVTGGDIEGAIQVYRRALAFDPAPELVAKVDDLLAQQGNPEDRLSLYRSALEQEQDAERRREFLHAIAMIQRRELKDVEAAIATWTLALEADPRDLVAHNALVDARAELGDLAGTYAELERLLPLVEGQTRNGVLGRMARVAAEQGETERALSHYKDLLGQAELSEDELDRIEALASDLSDGDTIRAVLEQRLARASEPLDQAQLLERLGSALCDRLGDTEAAADAWLRGARLGHGAAADDSLARRLYERVLRVVPESTEAAQSLIEIYARLGDWDRIPSAFSVLLRGDKGRDPIALLLTLETAAIEAEAVSEFVVLADAALSRKPEAVRGRQLLLAKARVLATLKSRRDEAAQIYRMLLESGGAEAEDIAEVFEKFLDRCAIDGERQEDFRWLYNWRVENAPEPSTGLMTWAQAEETQFQDLDAAVALYEKVVRLDPERTDAWTELARLQTAQGRAEGALHALEALRQRSEQDERVGVELKIAELLLNSLGRASDALSLVEPYVVQSPADPRALAIVHGALLDHDARPRAAELLEIAAEAADDPAQKSEVLEALLQLSRETPELASARGRWLKQLLETKVDDPEGSLEVALRAAEESPTDYGLWDAAERFARRLNQPDNVADAYARVMQQDHASEVAEVLGQRMVEFYEEWFDDSSRVVRILERVLELCPGAEWAFDRLKLAFNAAGRWEELFALYDRALEHATEPSVQSDLLREASMAAKDFAGAADRAVGYLERLYQLNPQDRRVEASLERLYERSGYIRPLIDLLSARLDSVETKGPLQERIATLWIQLDEALPALELIDQMLAVEPDAPGAIALLERLVVVPTSQSSLAPPSHDAGSRKSRRKKRQTVRERAAGYLKTFYQRMGRTADVVRMLEVEVDSAPNDKVRIERLSEIARVRLSELDDAAGAFDNFAALVRLDPASEACRQTLGELADRLDRHAQQVELLVSVAELSDCDALLRIQLLSEAAMVQKTRLEDHEQAISLFKRVLDLSADQPAAALQAARELDPMLERAGRDEERCGVLERLAELEESEAASRRARGEAARVAFQSLGDADRAIANYRMALEQDRNDLEALNGLCAALESARRWDELVLAYESRAKLGLDAEHVRRDLVSIAKIHVEHREDRALGIDAWRAVRNLQPGDREAFEALVVLLGQEERWTELAELLTDEAAQESEPERRHELERQLGDIHRTRTFDMMAALNAFVLAGDWQSAVEVAGAAHKDKAMAVDVCRALLEHAVNAWSGDDSPPDAGAPHAANWAISELSQRLLESGNHQEVVELLLEGAALPFEQSRKRELRREAACLCSDRLGKPERAIEIFQELFRELPGDEVAQASVTRLALLLDEAGQDSELVGLWERQAQCRAESGDASGAAVLWARAGELCEERLHDLERAIEDYRQGASVGGEAALDALARIYTDRGDHQRAAEVLEWLCAQASRDSLTGPALRLAEAYLAAGQAAKARARLEYAASAAIDAGPVRRRLAELYREAKDWTPLAELLSGEAARAHDTKTKLALLTEAASLHMERRDDPQSAVRLYQQALELDPEDYSLRLALSDALGRAERYDDAIAILSEQIERYGTRRPKARALIHWQLGKVCLAAGRREQALSELGLANKIDPAHPGVLEALARLALEQGELERSERMYRALLLVLGRESDDGAPSRAVALLDLSEIAARKDDPLRATEFVESAFEAALETDREAGALEQALRERGRHELLARCIHTRLRDTLPPAEAAQALADLVLLQSENVAGISVEESMLRDRAARIQERLESANTVDDAAWAALGRVYDWLGDREAESMILERRVRALEEQSGKLSDADPFYRLAAVCLADDSKRERGVELLERAMDIRPDVERAGKLLREIPGDSVPEARAVRLLEKIARASGDEPALAQALVLRLRLPETPMAVLREGVALASKLQDYELLQSMLDIALSQAPHDLTPEGAAWIRVELSRLRERAGEHEAALDLRESAASLVPPEQRRELLLQVADAAQACDDFERVSRVLRDLHEQEPADRKLWEPLLEAYRKLGQIEALTELLEQTVPLVDSAEDRQRLRHEQAQLLLERGDRDQAVEVLKQVLDEDPSHAEAAEQLSRLLDEVGRKAELVDILRLQLDAAKDRQSVHTVVAVSLRLGGLLEEQRQVPEALDAYRVVLDWERDNHEALLGMLRVAELGDDNYAVADAIEALLAVEARFPADGKVQSEASGRSMALVQRLRKLRELLGDSAGLERALEFGFKCNPLDAELREALIQRYTEREEHTRVAELLREALLYSPGDRALLQRVVQAYRWAGEIQAALEIVDKLVEDDPQEPGLYRNRAQLLSEAGRDDEALVDLERAYALDPEQSEQLVLGFERALERAPRSEELRLVLRLVEVLEGRGDIEEARARLRAYTERVPEERMALFRLARMDERVQDYAAAADAYEKLALLEEGDSLVEVALCLSEACERIDQLDRAVKALERALEEAPTHHDLRQRLRDFYSRSGQNSKLAGLLLQDAERLNDDSEKHQALLAAAELMLGAEGDQMQAIVVLERATQLSPEHIQTAVLLARAYTAGGRGDDALGVLNDVVAAQRGRRSRALVDVYQEIANLHLAEGFLTDALEALTKAHELDLRNGVLALKLGKLALESDEETLAMRAFRSVTMLKAGDDYDARATALLKADAHYHLALLSQRRGDERKAKILVAKALSENPEHAGAARLQAELRGV